MMRWNVFSSITGDSVSGFKTSAFESRAKSLKPCPLETVWKIIQGLKTPILQSEPQCYFHVEHENQPSNWDLLASFREISMIHGYIISNVAFSMVLCCVELEGNGGIHGR